MANYRAIMTALGYLLWFGGLAKVSVSSASVFTGVLPVGAVLRSYLIPGEPFSWVHPVGITCVPLAILLIARQRPDTREPAPRRSATSCQAIRNSVP